MQHEQPPVSATFTPRPRDNCPALDALLGFSWPVGSKGSVELWDYMGNETAVSQAARTSYKSTGKSAEDDKRLVRRLMADRHTSPNEMAELKLKVRCPLFVARQLVRHRSACLAGDARLMFDLPGAAKRRVGARQRHSIPIAEFHRIWHHGTRHPIEKKKPTYLDRISLDREYTIPELARLVDRREETLRTYVRFGTLAAVRRKSSDPKRSSIFVTGRAWQAFATQTHFASVDMKARLQRMQLRSCDEITGEIIHTNVVDIWESGVKPVFRVTLENGKSLKMSKDHRCLTENGWLTLEEATHLRVGSNGGVSWSGNAPAFAVNGVAAYRDAEWLGAKRAEGLDVTTIAAKAGVSYHTIRKHLQKHGLQFFSAEKSKLSGFAQRGTRRSPTGPRKPSESTLAAIRAARSGSASNFWKGGITSERANIGRWTSENAARTHERYGFACAICEHKAGLHAHHVDPVWHAPERARDPLNLMSLCSACHKRLHADNLEMRLLDAVQQGQELKTFWVDQPRQPRPHDKRKPRAQRLVRSFSRIASIELAGEEMTYDLEVAGPYHNFVADGFIVHNSMNEWSGRYTELPDDFDTVDPACWRTQSQTNKQGSGGLLPVEVGQGLTDRQIALQKLCYDVYQDRIAAGVAREQARIDLPLSIYTEFVWKFDLHNLLHFLGLRMDAHAQQETRDFANVIGDIVKLWMPSLWQAFVDFRLEAIILLGLELKLFLCSMCEEAYVMA